MFTDLRDDDDTLDFSIDLDVSELELRCDSAVYDINNQGLSKKNDETTSKKMSEVV